MIGCGVWGAICCDVVMREEGLGVGEFYCERVFACAYCAVGSLVERPIEIAFASTKDFDLVGFGWGFGIDPTWEAVVFVVAFAKKVKGGLGL